jgi:hypothetical protein
MDWLDDDIWVHPAIRMPDIMNNVKIPGRKKQVLIHMISFLLYNNLIINSNVRGIFTGASPDAG